MSQLSAAFRTARKRAGLVILALLITAFIIVSLMWASSYWFGGMLEIGLRHQFVSFRSESGAIFLLDIRDFPLPGKPFIRLRRDGPDRSWNRADIWGPTQCWWRYPNDVYRDPSFEWADGSWQNMLTSDLPTPMKYTAIQFPHWVLASGFGAGAIMLFLLRRLMKKRPRQKKKTAVGNRAFALVSAASFALFVAVMLLWLGKWQFYKVLVAYGDEYAFSVDPNGLNVSYFDLTLSPDFKGSNIVKSTPVSFAYLYVETVRETDVFGQPIAKWTAQIPLWYAVGITAILPLCWVARRLLRRRIIGEAQTEISICENCGYDIRANANRCSECGREIPLP